MPQADEPNLVHRAPISCVDMWQMQGSGLRVPAKNLPASHCPSRAQTWAAAAGQPGATSASARPSAARRA